MIKKSGRYTGLIFCYLLLAGSQIFCFSAAFISSSLKSGWAMDTSASARSQVDLPARLTQPYSVTM